jgi:galactitol-specific phosphotransferase system IIB component
MKIPNTSYRVVAIITIVVSVIGLVISPVSAAAAFSPSGNPTGIPTGNSANHHAFNSTQQAARLQTVLANLSQQGVDVSPAQANLAAGNVTAAAQWLMAYHKDHPNLTQNGNRQHTVNTTAQAARLQTVLANLSQQGVDVSQVTADITSGNITGAMKDLMALHKAHPGTMVNSTQLAARLQTEVTKLAQQGADVSVVQADLTSGNTNATKLWIATSHTTQHPLQKGGNITAWHSGNSTLKQQAGSFQPHQMDSGNKTASHLSFTGTWHKGSGQKTGA